MPLIRGIDIVGNYYKFGKHGHKYYYHAKDKKSRNEARHLAVQQGKAIHVRKG